MQDYSAYPTYVVNAGISGQDGSAGYYMDPRIHGGQQTQVTWREVPGSREDGSSSGITYPGGHYMSWEHKGYGSDIHGDEDYFNVADTLEQEPRKRKRRRVISVEQRRAANIRERKRMFQLNEAFCLLRKRVPTFAYEKKLSRIETLKLAVTYIKFMTELLEKEDTKGTSGSSETKAVLAEGDAESAGIKDPTESIEVKSTDLNNEPEK